MTFDPVLFQLLQSNKSKVTNLKMTLLHPSSSRAVCQHLQHTCSCQTHNGQVIASIASTVASYCCSVLPAVIAPIRCCGGMCRPTFPLPCCLQLPAQVMVAFCMWLQDGHTCSPHMQHEFSLTFTCTGTLSVLGIMKTCPTEPLLKDLRIATKSINENFLHTVVL